MKFKSEIDFTSAIVAGIGSIMGLIALKFNWYIIDCSGHGCDDALPLSLSYFDMFDLSKPNWAGNQLPLILSIVCFSISLLVVIYSIKSTMIHKKILLYAGIISILTLIAHIGYWEVELYSRSSGSDSDYILPRIGWVFAFIGAIAILIGAMMCKQKQEIGDRMAK